MVAETTTTGVDVVVTVLGEVTVEWEWIVVSVVVRGTGVTLEGPYDEKHSTVLTVSVLMVDFAWIAVRHKSAAEIREFFIFDYDKTLSRMVVVVLEC